MKFELPRPGLDCVRPGVKPLVRVRLAQALQIRVIRQPAPLPRSAYPGAYALEPNAGTAREIAQRHMVADDERRADRAEHIILLAWRDVPAYDRELLEEHRRVPVTGHDASRSDDLLRSAGYARLGDRAIAELELAAGAWISHSCELMLARVACMNGHTHAPWSARPVMTSPTASACSSLCWPA